MRLEVVVVGGELSSSQESQREEESWQDRGEGEESDKEDEGEAWRCGGEVEGGEV